MTIGFKLCRRGLAGAVLGALLVMMGLAQAGQAYNMPGSSQAVLGDTTEIATNMIVRSIKSNMRPMRDGEGNLVVSTMGDDGTAGIRGMSGGNTPLSFALTLRDVDNSRLDGSITVGTLLLGHQADSGVLVFGGLIGESSDLDTPLDNGRIENTGLGLTVGVDYQVSDQLYLTGLFGVMSLDYDVSRLGGTVTGSFGANRKFVDLSADYLTQAGAADLRLGFGLLYVAQDNDGYTESGGAVVAPMSQDQLSAMLGLRSTWSEPGLMRPYLDVSGWAKLSGSDGLPVALGPVSNTEWETRLAIGVERTSGASSFDLGLGANFGDDDFEGLDANLTYNLRF